MDRFSLPQRNKYLEYLYPEQRKRGEPHIVFRGFDPYSASSLLRNTRRAYKVLHPDSQSHIWADLHIWTDFLTIERMEKDGVVVNDVLKALFLHVASYRKDEELTVTIPKDVTSLRDLFSISYDDFA